MVNRLIIHRGFALRYITITTVTGQNTLTTPAVNSPTVTFTLGNQRLPTLGESIHSEPCRHRKTGAVLKIKHLLVLNRCLNKLVNTIQVDTFAKLTLSELDGISSLTLTMTVTHCIIQIPVKRPIGNHPGNQLGLCEYWNRISRRKRSNLIRTKRTVVYRHIIK